MQLATVPEKRALHYRTPPDTLKGFLFGGREHLNHNHNHNYKKYQLQKPFFIPP